MDLGIKPKQYRRNKKTRKRKQKEWPHEKTFKSMIDSIEQASKPYIYTFEFDKFLCVAFSGGNAVLSDKEDIKVHKDIIVHIADKKIVLHTQNVKKALSTRNSRLKVGFNYKTGNDIFLEFIDGYIQLECLKTNGSDLKRTIKLVEYKLCKN